MTRNTIELRQKRGSLVAECRAILKKADKASRDLTAEERGNYDRLFEEVSGLKGRIEREENVSDLETELRQRDGFDFNYHNDVGPTDGSGNEIRPRELRDLREGEIRVLAPNQRLADCPEVRSALSLPDGIKPEELSLGRLVRGIVTGSWKGAEAEHRALSVAEDIVGGFTVPDMMSVNIVDLVRNQARVIRAGARTVPMETSQLRIAIQESDPTAFWRPENTAITASDINFGLITLHAKTLAALVPVSVELMEDGQNTDAVVSNAISEALGLALDLAALRGEGDAISPTGIRNVTGIQTIDQGANGSAITNFDELSQAWEKILAVNGPETGLAAIYSTREAGTMDRFVDGQGQPQTPPLSVQGMKRLPTNQVPIDLTKGTSDDASEAYVGNFSEMLIGMRTQILIESSRLASDTTTGLGFSTMTVLVRAYLRVDIALVRPNQFVLIDGIIP